jgi:hypothetical protein
MFFIILFVTSSSFALALVNPGRVKDALFLVGAGINTSHTACRRHRQCCETTVAAHNHFADY